MPKQSVLADSIETARSWTMFPMGESDKHGLPHLYVQEHRAHDAVNVTIRYADDEDKDQPWDEVSISLSAKEWRALTSLPVHFDEGVPTR